MSVNSESVGNKGARAAASIDGRGKMGIGPCQRAGLLGVELCCHVHQLAGEPGQGTRCIGRRVARKALDRLGERLRLVVGAHEPIAPRRSDGDEGEDVVVAALHRLQKIGDHMGRNSKRSSRCRRLARRQQERRLVRRRGMGFDRRLVGRDSGSSAGVAQRLEKVIVDEVAPIEGAQQAVAVGLLR